MADADLFPIDRLTPLGREALERRRLEIKEAREEIAKLKANIKRAAVGAQRSGVGKVIEKIAPLLPGFTHDARDCRFLGEPIDYIVFRGLGRSAVVEHITFLDIKTREARLKKEQKQIRDAVKSGKVAWDTFRA